MTSSSIAEASRTPGLTPGVRHAAPSASPAPVSPSALVSGMLLSFAVLTVVTFLIVPLIPGDPAVIAAGDGASPAQIANVRA